MPFNQESFTGAVPSTEAAQILSKPNVVFSTKRGESMQDERTFQLCLRILRLLGETVYEVDGYYGVSEKSLLVSCPKNMPLILGLIEALTQECYVHSDGSEHSIKFLRGHKAGQTITFSRIHFFDEVPPFNHTKLLGHYFSYAKEVDHG